MSDLRHSAGSEEMVVDTLDLKTPNVARMYDYMLGGKDNFAVDRATADEIVRRVPEAPYVMRENRRYLGRVVRFLAKSGIRQFVDIGSGLPTQGNVHEIAQQVAPDAHVVYVDVDPVVLTHGQALLANSPGVAVIRGDARRTDDILNNPQLRALIDFDRPVAVLMLLLVHFIGDADDPHGVVARLCNAITPGSYLAVSHVTADFDADRGVREATAVFKNATFQITLRSRTEITRLFDAFELVDPGLTTLSMWRPDPGTSLPPNAERQWCYACVGRKIG